MKNLQTIAKDCTISIGIAVGIIAFMEASFRVSKFTLNRVESAFNQSEEFRDRFVAFDKKVPINILQARQREVSDHLMYKPWIQIGNYDHKGEFSNVINGKRAVKGLEPLKDCSSIKEIWMFGGSTTYGVGVPYSENIPSYLQQILNSHHACYKVINYGVPYHYSKQETINFVNNLLDNDKSPSIAIFLDGLNDFGQPGSTIRGEPHFTPVLTSLVPKGSNPASKSRSNSPILFNLEIISFLQKKISRSSVSSESHYSNYDLPAGYTDVSAAKEISEKFTKNTFNLGKICEVYVIKCFRFLQPVAAVDYTPPSNDALTPWTQDNKKATRFRNGYNLVRGNTSTDFRGIKFIDISRVFRNYAGIPYVDFGHYSPRANKLIANSIYSAISPVVAQP